MAAGNKTIDFFVDTGATHLVLNTKLTKKSSAAVMVTGVTEQAFLQTGISATSGMPPWGSKADA